MAEYSEYKESGIPWIGKIPSHWDIIPLRAFLELTSNKGYGHMPLLSVTREKGIVLRGDKGDDDKNNIIPEDLSNYKLVKAGDFVINKMKSWQGSYGLSDYDGIVSPAYFTYKLKFPNKSFFSRALRSKAYIPFFMQYSKGIRVDQWDLKQNALKSIPFFVPPKDEQEAIVAYLDKVTADMDKAIAAKERIIASLEERLKIIITHAVTRGINPDTPLKNSGIDWLGQIPAHWETYPVRHFFDFRNGYTPSKANTSFWTNGTIPWFRMEDIRKSGRFLDKSIQYVTPSALNNGGTFEAGSFILAICTASIGEHAMLIADSLVNQRFANLKIRKSLSTRTDSMFIFYYMYVLGRFCKDTANTTTFQYADMTQVKNFIVPLPPIEEQQEIVKFLEYNTSGIDTAITQQKKLIDLLRERKNIIINETVTGKVKVI